MTSLRRALATPFGSALLGGLVVAAALWVAIAAGWIEADEDRASGWPRRRCLRRRPATNPAAAA